ncbi:MAG: sensor histidine kinase [Deltaproteobacteria bacterium]|nr:sensor histidine kinase [Deltaproteobacteria bacterium]
MKYSGFQKKIISITLLVSLAPLLILGLTIYYQFAGMYKEKIKEQIKYRARSQAETVDLFLKERTAILSAIADTHTLKEMVGEEKLSGILEIMNRSAGAFLDLGVIDRNGRHLTYVGPYNLKDVNYNDQPWFAEVMARGVYISDVYMGFRKLPHFIIAVRHRANQESWILRATIDPEIFGEIVRSAKIGQTGDAYIVDENGLYQTAPRFGGKILTDSGVEPKMFGRETVIELRDGSNRKILFAGSWSNTKKWLFIISQDSAEEMKGLFATRNVEIVIVSSGILAMILTIVFTTRLAVNRLREADVKMNELNAQLVQSDKLAALGKMAAGVAHEINNPLAVIFQKTGLIEDLLAEGDFRGSGDLQEFKDAVKKIEEHVERARKVVHGMLGYARKMEPYFENVNINETINQTIALLGNYARINNIIIQTDLPDDLPTIASDEAQLQQVIFNLVSNAIDAIGTDGLIQIVCRIEDQNIIVRITDDGPGMPEDVQKHIFDPFYTTKDASMGTGLGLWVSHNIMEKMGGVISLESREQKGTTFTMQIPIGAAKKNGI